MEVCRPGIASFGRSSCTMTEWDGGGFFNVSGLGGRRRTALTLTLLGQESGRCVTGQSHRHIPRPSKEERCLRRIGGVDIRRYGLGDVKNSETALVKEPGEPVSFFTRLIC